jgi:hypothetical protein
MGFLVLPGVTGNPAGLVPRNALVLIEPINSRMVSRKLSRNGVQGNGLRHLDVYRGYRTNRPPAGFRKPSFIRSCKLRRTSQGKMASFGFGNQLFLTSQEEGCIIRRWRIKLSEKDFLAMAQQPSHSLREALLTEVLAQSTPGPMLMPNLQQGSVLNAVATTLGARNNPDLEEAILTQWADLFRTGLLAWGLNLANPNPPFFHLTERGRQVFQYLARDPSNPAGYLCHRESIATLEPVAMSYLTEGLECYVAGLFKAAAVMVGGAAESVVLTLRDHVIQKLTLLHKSIPSGMRDWRFKTVSDALRSFFEAHAEKFNRELLETFEAYWPAFNQQIRAARNDAGHPVSVDPVTPDTVHASLLIFPELVKLSDSLSRWIVEQFA